MQVSLVGGAGFIGTALAARLRTAGVGVGVVDRLGDKGRAPVDICDAAALQAALTGDTVVHLAAVHTDDVEPASDYSRVNVDGTRNLARAAEARGIRRIVFVSSAAVYGDAVPRRGEDAPTNPTHAYGQSKLAAEAVMRDWQAADPGGRSLVIVRPTAVFGPGGKGNLHLLAAQIARGRFMIAGDGRNTKSLCHVDNLAAFLQLVATDARFGPGVHLFNYADGPDFDMNELVALIRWHMTGRAGPGPRLPMPIALMLGVGADLVARWRGRPGAVSLQRVRKAAARTALTSAAHDLPGFRATVDLRQGLLDMLQQDFPRAGEQLRQGATHRGRDRGTALPTVG